jgi:hypothetical protein
MQMTIFDFVDDGKTVDSVRLNRIQSIFPDWEVLGYVRSWEWEKSDDYTAVVHRDGVYKMVHAELYHDGKNRAAYGQRIDFEPHWFDWYENEGRHWVWRSLDDRNRVMEAAIYNRG